MYQKFIGECDCSVIGGMFYYPTAKRTYDAKTCGDSEEVENAAATFEEKQVALFQSIVDVIENKKRLEEQEKKLKEKLKYLK